jgi:hypothetical protein
MKKYICLVILTPLIAVMGCVTPYEECEEMCDAKEELREVAPNLFMGEESWEECVWGSVEKERSPAYCDYMSDYFSELTDTISSETDNPTYYDPDNDGEPN